MQEARKEQWQIIRQAKRDLIEAGLPREELALIHTRFARLPERELGNALLETVTLNELLTGPALYKTYLHEVGHVLGLGHCRKKTHLMFGTERNDALFTGGGTPTDRQRKRWVRELIEAWHALKIGQWRPQ